MDACMIAPTKIIAGLGMSLGIQVLCCPGATGSCLASQTLPLVLLVVSMRALREPDASHTSTVMHAGDYKTQFHAKAATMADALINGPHGFGFLHVKAVDDTGHDRAVPMKVGGTLPPLALPP
jgi:2,3-bisphosphoglycerate-independent phosphoglycerate mutase